VRVNELSAEELRTAVDALARSEQVSDFALETDASRAYRELVTEGHLSAWVIRWGETADTGFHDHDVSAGAVHVIEGRVREERLVVGSEPRVRTYGPGESFAFEAADIHRVSHAGDNPALTVHLYSPPLRQMGAYLIERSGLLRRLTISYEEELKPLTPA
jgi:quercetin dioxygenase-like cupin family protein